MSTSRATYTPSPARGWTSHVVIAGAVAAAVAGLTVGPAVGLGVAVVVGALLLAPILHTQIGISPWWPVCFVAILQPLNRIRPLPNVAIGDVALVLLGLCLIPLLRRAALPPRVFIPLAGTLVLAAGGLLGTIVTQDWGLSASTSETSYYGGSGLLIFKFILGAPCVIAIIAIIAPSVSTATVLARAYAVGAGITSVAAISGQTDPYFQRAFGLSAHQMHLALSAMIGAVVCLGWLVQTRSNVQRAFAVVLGLLNVWGMLLSGSRSALLGMVAAVVYLALLAGKRGVLGLVGGGVVSATGLYLLTPFMPQGSTLYRLFGHGELQHQTVASNNQHLEVAYDAIKEIGEHPFTGLGFGQGLDAHNLLLEAANIGGVLGVVGVCLIWGTFLTLWVRSFRWPDKRDHALPLAMLAAVLGYFVLGQLENIIWDRHLWFFISLTLFAALEPTARRASQDGDEPDATHAVDGRDLDAPAVAPLAVGGPVPRS